MNKPERSNIPTKLYIGAFARLSRFDAHFDETVISLPSERKGDPVKSLHWQCGPLEHRFLQAALEQTAAG
jgi:hypothetical protein